MPASGDLRDRRDIHILVASEDGSRHATEVVRQIARRVLQSLVVHPAQRVHWPPIEAAHHPVVNAMQWKSRRSADMPAVRALQARLARHLGQGPDCFVFFSHRRRRSLVAAAECEHRSIRGAHSEGSA